MPLPSVLLLIAGAAIYWNSLTNPFLFDDVGPILTNPHIRQLWPITSVLFGRSPERPLANLSFALNYAAGRWQPQGYHAVNLAIHLAVALTLYGLIRRTLLHGSLREQTGQAASGLACAASLLWTVHPLLTECVTYLAHRAELLMSLGYAMMLYALARSDVSPHPRRWERLAVVACVMGMASKPVMVTAPIMALLYDRTFMAGSIREAFHQRGRLYAALALTWLIPAVLLVMVRNAESAIAGTDLASQFTVTTPWRYAATQPAVLLHYLRLTVWPHPLVVDYGWPPVRDWHESLGSGLLIDALVAVTAWGAWRRRAWGFAGVWTWLILLPTSSVIPIADLAAERRMYLPLAGLVVLVTVGGWNVLRRCVASAEVRRSIAGALVAAITLTFAVLTIRRNRDYQSELAMWQQVVAVRPAHARAQNNLGVALNSAGREREAVGHYAEALRLKPVYPEARYNLAVSLAQLGFLDEAMRNYEEAIRLKPDLPDAHHNLGVVLAQLGRLDEAAAQFREAIRLMPSRDSYVNLGLTLRRQGRDREAAEAFRAASR